MNKRIVRAFALAQLQSGRPAECPRDLDPVEWAKTIAELARDRDFHVTMRINPETSRWEATKNQSPTNGETPNRDTGRRER